MRLVTFDSRLFKALDIILQRLESNQIGLQFLISPVLDFFGISVIVAPRKLSVKEPLPQQHSEYLSRGYLRYCQHRLISGMTKPSAPGADRELPSSTAVSSSPTCSGASREFRWSSDSFEFLTKSEFNIFGPKKFSIMFSQEAGWLPGFLQSCSQKETMCSSLSESEAKAAPPGFFYFI